MICVKKCKGCGAEKERSSFYRLKSNKDGLTGKCKECTKAQVRANREAKAEYYRAFDRARANDPKRVKARAEYAKTDAYRDSHKKAVTNYRRKNPIKYAAITAVGNAVRNGEIIPEPCEVCSDEKVHGHHDDYRKPLSVRWLCSKHHREWHKKHGEALGCEP